MVTEYEFMRPWFELLRGHVTVYEGAAARKGSLDCVRVGQRHDLWLCVVPTGAQREAVLLTSHFATIDYACYEQWMLELSGLQLPSYFVRGVDKLPNQYALLLGRSGGARTSILSSTLWGPEEANEVFVRDLERVKELLSERRGVAWDDVEPVPLMVYSTRHWPSLSNTIEGFQTGLRQDGERRVDAGVGFELAALEISLHGSLIDWGMLQLWPVCSALECGTTIEYAKLPYWELHDFDVYKAPTMVDFTQLIRDVALDGHVRHLVVDWGTTHYFPRLCSALVSARGLRTLELARHAGMDDAFGNRMEERLDAWRWLAFALFSAASTSSVETLVINGSELKAEDMDAVREMITATDPLRWLAESCCSFVKQPSDLWMYTEKSTRPRITFQPDTSVRLWNGYEDGGHVSRCEWYSFEDDDEDRFNYTEADEQDIRDVVRDRTWTGEVVQQRITSGGSAGGVDEAIVFVEGVGFCKLDTQHRTVVTTTTDMEQAHRSSSSFHTLVIKYNQEAGYTLEALPRLLELIGSRLRGLSIQVLGVHDQLLECVFASCPRLENLAINGAALSSLQVFAQAYDKFKLPLSSLDLCVLKSMPLRAFEDGLALLSSHNSVLSRLRLGYQPVSDEDEGPATVALSQFLDCNRSLTHVSLVVASDAQFESFEQLCEHYHGQVVMCPRRLALLGSLRRLAQTHRQMELNSHVVGLIFAFGLPRRSVCWEIEGADDIVVDSDDD